MNYYAPPRARVADMPDSDRLTWVEWLFALCLVAILGISLLGALYEEGEWLF